MSNNAIEKKVKANASKLDKCMDDFKAYFGKYITFNGEGYILSDSFDSAVKQGDKTFGADSGFVVRKLGAVPSFSNLVIK